VVSGSGHTSRSVRTEARGAADSRSSRRIGCIGSGSLGSPVCSPVDTRGKRRRPSRVHEWAVAGHHSVKVGLSLVEFAPRGAEVSAELEERAVPPHRDAERVRAGVRGVGNVCFGLRLWRVVEWPDGSGVRRGHGSGSMLSARAADLPSSWGHSALPYHAVCHILGGHWLHAGGHLLHVGRGSSARERPEWAGGSAKGEREACPQGHSGSPELRTQGDLSAEFKGT